MKKLLGAATGAGLALALLFACDRGDASHDGCRLDRDCPDGHCVAGACVSFRNPLDATVPELALDGGTDAGG